MLLYIEESFDMNNRNEPSLPPVLSLYYEFDDSDIYDTTSAFAAPSGTMATLNGFNETVIDLEDFGFDEDGNPAFVGNDTNRPLVKNGTGKTMC